MKIIDYSKMWNISSTKIKSLIEDESIPLIDGEIPSNIRGIVLVDRRFNKMENLKKDHILILMIAFTYCHFYYNSKLLNMNEMLFNEYLSYLLNNKLIVKLDNLNYSLTSKGVEVYLKNKEKHPKLVRMLLGSIKVNKDILVKMEDLL